MAFDLDPSYKQVPERIADFKAKHPEGTLQPLDPAVPYRIETIGSQVFIVYTAKAVRHPGDTDPGVGSAWEPFPGKTPYTRDSELQNAETSAWGRAIVAALASESKSVASAEDIRNRNADQQRTAPEPPPPAAENAAALRSRFEALPAETQAKVLERAAKAATGEPPSIDDLVNVLWAEWFAATLTKAEAAVAKPPATSDEKPVASTESASKADKPPPTPPAPPAPSEASTASGDTADLTDAIVTQEAGLDAGQKRAYRAWLRGQGVSLSPEGGADLHGMDEAALAKVEAKLTDLRVAAVS